MIVGRRGFRARAATSERTPCVLDTDGRHRDSLERALRNRGECAPAGGPEQAADSTGGGELRISLRTGLGYHGARCNLRGLRTSPTRLGRSAPASSSVSSPATWIASIPRVLMKLFAVALSNGLPRRLAEIPGLHDARTVLREPREPRPRSRIADLRPPSDAAASTPPAVPARCRFADRLRRTGAGSSA